MNFTEDTALSMLNLQNHFIEQVNYKYINLAIIKTSKAWLLFSHEICYST